VPDRPRHASTGSRGPGDGLVRAGALLFAVGVVGVLGVVVPFFLERDEAPAVWSVLASLTPLGLAVALVGLLRGARAGRRGDD
jgi:VIT1/CCC1 family predicted Fe2+/Mn2+ transporter